MSFTITETITLETETCSSCHIIFAIPRTLQQQAKTWGNVFYCPNGHGQKYQKNEVQSLREEVAAKARALTEAKCDVAREQAQRNAAEVRLAEVASEFRRHKRRVHNGVCPCCNRSFVNLQRHMKTKHPEHQPK